MPPPYPEVRDARPAASPRGLLLLALVCALPAWLLAGTFALQGWQREVAAREAQALTLAQAVREGLDLQLAAAVAGSAAVTIALPDTTGWSADLIDERGLVVARAGAFDRLRGPPRDALAQAARGAADQGVLRLRSAAGVPTLVAYSRLRSKGWLAAVGVSERTLLGDLPGWLSLQAMAGALALFASTAGAAWLAHRMLERARRLARAAAGHARTMRLLQQRTLERDEAVMAHARLASEHRHDPLTRLVHRGVFMNRLAACMGQRTESGGPLAVFFIDIDNFKAVNDSYGHAIGDALLAAFATRLQGGVRDLDLTARLGGDEFAVLIDGLTAQEAEPIAQSLLDRLSQPYGLGEHNVRVTASIGVAAFPHDAPDAAALLHAADAAMYEAKSAGKALVRLQPRESAGSAAS